MESKIGMWYTNTVVEYARHLQYTLDMTSGYFSKVLVIYCGGTIGMRHSPLHGYYPVSGYLADFLSQNTSFNDAQFGRHLMEGAVSSGECDISTMDKAIGPVLVMPQSIYGKRIAFQILEYDPLKDSSNMTMSDWIHIACDIEKHYHAYDAFVVLHGTDTMAYTVSALSFLLENLGKSVVFTGSQIPFCEVRNDAKDNLLGALTIAGHFVIPEVTLFFANKLLRGNRASKVNAVEFDAFATPNLKPLAQVGVNIEIEWGEILRATKIAPFKAHKTMDPNVGTLRIFPGITESAVRAFLLSSSPPMKGVILETFGMGNAPDNRPELIQVISEAIQRGTVIVNITQCQRGGVMASYSTGHALMDAGVVSGGDMTAECALTKLSFLLALPDHNEQMVAQLMTESLRGELTIPIVPHRANGDQKRRIPSWLGSVLNSAILATTVGNRDAVDKLLRPFFLHVAASQNDVDALRDLVKRATHLDSTDYDGRTALHVAISQCNLSAVKWLLKRGASIHYRDHRERTALMGAFEVHRERRSPESRSLVELLIEAGGAFPSTSKCLLRDAFQFASTGDLELLQILHQAGYDLSAKDLDGRTILHSCVIHGQVEILHWLKSIGLFQELQQCADKLGRTAKDVSNPRIIHITSLYLLGGQIDARPKNR